MIESMTQLKPLTLRHYCYPFGQQALTDSPELVREICRVLGSVPCWVKAVSPGHADATPDAMAVEMGALAADLDVPIGLFHTPWLDVSIDDAVAIENELVAFERRCDDLRETLGENVAWIQIDDEAWDDVAPERALPHRLLMLEILRHHWPQIEISWYNWGGWNPAANDVGWVQRSTYGLSPEAVNVACYHGPHIELIHESIRRTAASTTLPLELQLSFGQGYRPGKGGKFSAFERPWNYETDYSWMLGWIVGNREWCSKRPQRFAPYDRLRCVVVWPQLLSESSPQALEHFLAYCKGVNDVQD